MSNQLTSELPQRKCSKRRVRYVAVALIIINLALPTPVGAKENFIVTGLSNINEEYPWLESYYPNYKMDIHQALVTDPQFSSLLVGLRKKYPQGTIELYLSDYLGDELLETIVTAGVGIAASLLSGGIAGVFSSFSSDTASRFKVTLGNNSYNAAVPRDNDQSIELPEKQEENKIIRDQLYKHIQESFVEDALIAIGIINKQIEKQQEAANS